ncbi:D-ribitol-5-phosphate cytidylyltransferase [Oryzias latipes]|uniref:D-ribitol-5-phosphate cytidylyltransferase n=1 Tax=Oryzias latipes TaxID=8090 RepID=H2MQ93_ORYLA|nr:D-ribitol-5-phosphate cytidylyltransferase [Oryzias latipes]
MEVLHPNVRNKCEGPGRPANPGVFLDGRAGKGDTCSGEPSIDFPVSVVLPAGGTGERTGLHTPKQFCSLLGRPLISYTIQAFERVSWIQHIVVVVAKESMGLMADIIQRFQHHKVLVVSGGSTRHRSICNGVLALDEEGTAPDRPRVVIIHDAVRPFVEEGFLREIAVAAKDHGAAGAIRPLVSTVIATTSEGFLDHSLERAKYRASEMPQGFTHHVIRQAYQRCTEADFEFGTECLHLALQYCGTNAKLIEGPPTLWKVTYKKDLAAAESVLKESLSESACMITGGRTAAAALAEAFQKAAGALHMGLDPIPDVTAENSRYLLKESNFIQVSINGHCLSEVEALIKALEEANPAALHPLVIIWMRVLTEDEASDSSTAAPTSALLDMASTAKLHQILLYGIQFLQSKDSERWQRSVTRAAEITRTLIRERSPALVGQLLQA